MPLLPCYPLAQNALPPTLGLLPPPAALASVALVSSPGRSRVQETALAWSTSNPPQASAAAGRPIVTTSTDNYIATGYLGLQPHAGSSQGLSLSPATEPFPQRVVDKVRSGQYVDMRDLMTDNISLLQQLEAVGSQGAFPALPGVLKPRLREVATLPSWLYCFLAYVAIQSQDTAIRDMLAYARMMIREAQRHGGTGWLDYDRVFRQQAALDRTLKWNVLHPGIQAATLTGAGRGTGPAMFCTLCREADHNAESCALAYLQQPSVSSLAGPTFTPTLPRTRTQNRQHPERSEPPIRICASWNRGSCIYPNTCAFTHVCSNCRQRHMARDCPRTSKGGRQTQNNGGGGRPVKPRP